VLLEPLEQVEVTTPNDYLGDVMGDLSSRRGHIVGTEAAESGYSTVRAVVPQAELHLYATQLSSLSHGRATYVHRFSGYEQMPSDAAQRVISEYGKESAAAG
jgi:elongation factor G